MTSSTAAKPATEHPAGPGTAAGVAAEVWQAMRTIVLDNERRREACDALDLSFARVKALIQVAAGPLCQRDLTAALGSDAAYITLVLDELERRGLVERAPDPGDRRRKLVSITAAGATAAARASTILATPAEGVAALPEEDLKLLLAVLKPVAEGSHHPTGPGTAPR